MTQCSRVMTDQESFQTILLACLLLRIRHVIAFLIFACPLKPETLLGYGKQDVAAI